MDHYSTRSIPGYYDGPVKATSTTFKFVYAMSPTNAECVYEPILL